MCPCLSLPCAVTCTEAYLAFLELEGIKKERSSREGEKRFKIKKNIIIIRGYVQYLTRLSVFGRFYKSKAKKKIIQTRNPTADDDDLIFETSYTEGRGGPKGPSW